MNVVLGRTLNDAINRYRSKTGGGLPEPLVMFYALQLLDLVDWLHSVNILHCDIKPDNILLLINDDLSPMVRFGKQSFKAGLQLIDFGKSIDLSQFPQGTKFWGRSGSQRLWCPEMVSGYPWTYQIDYYGFCNTVHCMLFGSYLRCSSQGHATLQFKRYWNVSLWEELFSNLMMGANMDASATIRTLLRRTLSENGKLVDQIRRSVRALEM